MNEYELIVTDKVGFECGRFIDLECALIFLKALFDEYYNETDISFTIRQTVKEQYDD